MYLISSKKKHIKVQGRNLFFVLYDIFDARYINLEHKQIKLNSLDLIKRLLSSDSTINIYDVIIWSVKKSYIDIFECVINQYALHYKRYSLISNDSEIKMPDYPAQSYLIPNDSEIKMLDYLAQSYLNNSIDIYIKNIIIKLFNYLRNCASRFDKLLELSVIFGRVYVFKHFCLISYVLDIGNLLNIAFYHNHQKIIEILFNLFDFSLFTKNQMVKLIEIINNCLDQAYMEDRGDIYNYLMQKKLSIIHFAQ